MERRRNNNENMKWAKWREEEMTDENMKRAIWREEEKTDDNMKRARWREEKIRDGLQKEKKYKEKMNDEPPKQGKIERSKNSYDIRKKKT